MSFEVFVELHYSGDWQDISEYVRPGVSIKRGFRQGTGRGLADPQECTFTLVNRDGRFSPRNPRSPLYGLIGRNTPMRVRVEYNGETYTRFSGEVASWPTTWDKDRDVLVPVTAAGPLRRLGRLPEDPASPLRQVLANPDNGLATVAYWPMEEGATSLGAQDSWGSGLDGGPDLVIQSGATRSELSEDWLASKPLPRLGSANAFASLIEPSGAGTAMTAWIHVEIPSGGLSSAVRLLTVYTRGTAAAYTIYIGGTGNDDLRLLIQDDDFSTLVDTGYVTFNLPAGRYRLAMMVEQDGTSVDYSFGALREGDASGTTSSGTLSNRTVGTILGARLSFPPDAGAGDLGVGHIHLSSDLLSLNGTSDQLKGFDGETTKERFERVAALSGVSFAGFGDTDQTMGPQPIASLVDILRDIAEVEGVVTDRMTSLGLVWRGEGDRAAADVLQLDYSAGEVSGRIALVEDDSLIVNDVTVNRTAGATGRFQVDTGPLSTQEPPAGAGRYAESVTLNLGTDAHSVQQAAWRAYVGTHDEARVDVLRTDLGDRNDLIETVMQGADGGMNGIDLFDILEVVNPPDWMPPGSLRQSILGYSEELDGKGLRWTIDWFTKPQAPHDYLILDGDDGTGLLDARDSTLAADIDADDTSLSVAVTERERWITTSEDATAFPLDIVIDQERMTVTDISGTTSPQTFTVTRGADGYVAAHSTGDQVSLARPRRIALP